ncbi:MAG TPA: T9SS type A sorting domain-containing protein, partial [Chitinophagales bacterium]|nr:T9SS type A sorting domain-containing protein [Chitinophagales bacterium]
QDGDHFIVTADKLILVSEANSSDFQHNWLPATNKTAKGTKFYLFSNKTQLSLNDINVMAYDDATTVQVTKISKSPTLQQGYTNIDFAHDTVVFRKTISPGKDLIYYYSNGKDVLQPGETYMITSNKEVTIQYGALYTREHDGGGYVPSANGSSSGALFYFTVPFEDSAQQEIRITSWSDNNNIQLQRYNNGQWVTMQNFTGVGKLKAVEWVGRSLNQTYGTVFRVSCSSNKTISVFESNWIETGSTLTSDVGAMATAQDGTCAGKEFLVYMSPPCAEENITNPATGLKMPGKATHAYIFGNKNSTAHVTVKDDYTNGATISRSYSIGRGSYVDCMLDTAQWKSIYNGTGTMEGGSQRPYLHIQSDVPVAVMVSNHNDNWMMFYGSSMSQNLTLTTDCSPTRCQAGDTVDVTTHCDLNGFYADGGSIWQIIDDGLSFINSYFYDITDNSNVSGHCERDNISGRNVVTFPGLGTLNPDHQYEIRCRVVANHDFSDHKAIDNNSVLTVETSFMAEVEGDSEMVTGSANIALLDPDSIETAIQSPAMATTNTPLQIYPNPAHSQVSVMIPDADADMQLRVFDMSGWQVFYKNVSKGIASDGQTVSIPVDGFEPGVYLVEAIIGEKHSVQKLVVQ